jgi:hypothetical protein
LKRTGLFFSYPRTYWYETTFFADDDFRVRLAVSYQKDKTRVYLKEREEWELFFAVQNEDLLTTRFIGLDRKGSTLYLMDSRGRTLSGVTAVGLDDRTHRVIAEEQMADIEHVVLDPATLDVQAVVEFHPRVRVRVLDRFLADEKRKLKLTSAVPPNHLITSRSLDGRRWAVRSMEDEPPTRYWFYDQAKGRGRFLCSGRQEADRYPSPGCTRPRSPRATA